MLIKNTEPNSESSCFRIFVQSVFNSVVSTKQAAWHNLFNVCIILNVQAPVKKKVPVWYLIFIIHKFC